jgi:hypothetical protein
MRNLTTTQHRFCGLLFRASIARNVEDARYCEWEGDVEVNSNGVWTCGGCGRRQQDPRPVRTSNPPVLMESGSDHA